MVFALVKIDLLVMNSRKKASFSPFQFWHCQTRVCLPIEDIQEKEAKEKMQASCSVQLKEESRGRLSRMPCHSSQMF